MSVVTEVDTLVPEESSKPATSWGPVIAGGVTAAAATLVLTLAGSGLGLTAISPFSGEGVSLATLSVSAAVWLIFVQWIAALMGGYIAGRLRTKWVNIHSDEVFFRDTAHGFLAWALATLLVAGILGSALSAMVGAGVQATATAAGAATGAAASVAAGDDMAGDPGAYFVDTLLRPANPATPPAAGAPDQSGQVAGEVSRILAASALNGQMLPEDRTYLEQVVAARTGLPPADAKARVDYVLARAEQARVAAVEAAETARKTSATVALAGALSLVIGAFIASVAAAIGGRLRDENEGALMAR